MKHFGLKVDRIEFLDCYLSRPDLQRAIEDASSILVQVYWDCADPERVSTIATLLKLRMPRATVTGCSVGGHVCEGRVSADTVTVSIAVFSHATAHAVMCVGRPGAERENLDEVLRLIERLPDARALLLLAPPVEMECGRLLSGLDEALRDITVLGGGAAATAVGGAAGAKPAEVLLGTEIRPHSLAAVALCGSELEVMSAPTMGWRALGPSMTVTEVDGYRIRTIDHEPAIDVYRRYLNIDLDDVFLLEFPLLAYREAGVIARNPIAAEADGSLLMIADMQHGDSVKLGYIDVDDIIAQAQDTQTRLREFAPEAVFVYSCVCRYFTLREDAELETLLFQHLAPTAGFYTAGEFCRIGGRLQLHNSAHLVVAMREGGISSACPLPVRPPPLSMDPHRLRHMRLTSRLLKSIGALTEKLEEANRNLLLQAERDPLTNAFNRRVFDERFDGSIARAGRHNDRVSVIFIDLDHFKSINDTYGHQAGDAVLRSAAATIGALIRLTDLLCRYGGEEFALIMPETSLALALVVAERLRAGVAALRPQHGASTLPPVTASFGVATYPDHGSDAASVIAAADAALYRAKALGRNCVIAADTDGDRG